MQGITRSSHVGRTCWAKNLPHFTSSGMNLRHLHPLKAVGICNGRRLLQLRTLAFQVSSSGDPAKFAQKPAEDPASSYIAPPLIDEVFASAYDELKEHLAGIYAQMQRTRKLSKTRSEDFQAQAEKYNPEVHYNCRFDRSKIDMTQPVYRYLMQKEWEQHDLMVTMQRLEQLHVIPDTLPTVEPRADVKVQFCHNTAAEFSGYVVPGLRMPTFAVARPPTVKVQEFRSSQSSGLYSLVIVNPDVPYLAGNTFRTLLNYGVYNVPLNFVENVISPAQLQHTPERVFFQYRPLVPEKNAPTQRACVWVFRQERQLPKVSFDADNFDVRGFANEYGLDAIGAHVWRQDFDRSTNAVREQYGMARGVVYDSKRSTKPLV